VNLQLLTTGALLMLHGSIRDALAVDDNTPDGKEKLFQVRENADWREQANALEEQLDRRGAAYDKIRW
jgi:hypothetical protein